MKTIVKIAILFFCLNGFGQLTHIDIIPFEGTWEAQFGQNKVFRLILWGEGDVIKGDYEIDQLDSNGNVLETYESNFTLKNSTKKIGSVIYGGVNSNTYAYGTIDDNTIDAEQGFSSRKIKWGGFSLIIQSFNPTTAKWKVKRPPGIILSTEPENYSIPTDIVLTKVN